MLEVAGFNVPVPSSVRVTFVAPPAKALLLIVTGVVLQVLPLELPNVRDGPGVTDNKNILVYAWQGPGGLSVVIVIVTIFPKSPAFGV